MVSLSIVEILFFEELNDKWRESFGVRLVVFEKKLNVKLEKTFLLRIYIDREIY